MIDAKSLVGEDGLYPDDIAEILANADPVKKAMLLRTGARSSTIIATSKP